MKYTIEQFKLDYSTDIICMDKIFKIRYKSLKVCPNCNIPNPKFRKISTRRAYQCSVCYHQIYPTAGTIFEGTTTPLTFWFQAIYLMTVTRNGVAAKELQRVTGVTYKTAWRMAKKIRELMSKNKQPILGNKGAFVSQLKRSIKGTYIKVSKKYYNLYSDECHFRYNNRLKGEKMFDVILNNLL